MTTSDAQIARQWAEAWAEEPTNHLLAAVHRHILATTTPAPTMADVGWDDEVHAGLCAVYTAEDVAVRMIAPDILNADYVECCWLRSGFMTRGTLPRRHLTPIPGTKIDLTPRREPVNSDSGPTDTTITEKPHPEDVPVGEVWEVEAVGYGKWAGTRSNPGNSNAPWTLIRVDSCDYYWAKDGQVTLVRRLVPEAVHDHPTILSSVEDYDNAPTGTVIAYADDVAVKRDDGRWYWSGQSGTSWAEDFADADPCTVVRWGK